MQTTALESGQINSYIQNDKSAYDEMIKQQFDKK